MQDKLLLHLKVDLIVTIRSNILYIYKTQMEDGVLHWDIGESMESYVIKKTTLHRN